MSPEQMVARLQAISDSNLRAVRSDPTKNVHDLKIAQEHVDRVRPEIPPWVDALYHSTISVKPPRVFKVRSQYGHDMVVLVDGLYVAVQAFLILPGGMKHRITKMSDVAGNVGHRVKVPIPRLAKAFYVDHRESLLVEKDVELSTKIAQLTSLLTGPVLGAYEEVKRLAPGMVTEFRSETTSEDEGRLAEKLLPYLDNNPLAALSPESLSLIFKTPWKELERLVFFLKSNRALAGGADPESVEYALRLMTAKKVMDS